MECDDNIRFTLEDLSSDLVSSLQAGLDATCRKERFGSDTRIGLRALRYLQASDMDREDISAETSLLYDLMERMSVNGRVSYQRDSSLETELQETGLVTNSLDRTRTAYGGSLAFRLTERQDLNVDVSVGRTEYESETQVDYDTSSLNLNWVCRLRDGRDGLTVRPYWNRQSSEVSRVESLGLLLGWTRLLTETWSLNVFLGIRKTGSEYSYLVQKAVFDPDLLPAFPFRFELLTLTEEESSWGGVADVSADWKGETWSFHSSYNRDLSYSSQGDPINRDQLSVSVRKALDERWSAACGGSVSLSRYESQSSDQGYRQASLSPSLSYRLTEDHWLSAGFNYDYYENEQDRDSGWDRKRVWISLNCRFPRLW